MAQTSVATRQSVRPPGRKSLAAGVPSGAGASLAGSICSRSPSSQSRTASEYSTEAMSMVTLPASTIALIGVAGLSASCTVVLMPVSFSKGFACASVCAAP